MTGYHLAIALHLIAMGLWLGHMFVWSLLAGPALKKIEPPETAELLRERSLYLGGIGWPALAVLVFTGAYLLSLRGIGWDSLLSGAAFQGAPGTVLAVKLVAVAFMVLYQAVFAHRRSSVIYLNMGAALVILGASVALVRGWV